MKANRLVIVPNGSTWRLLYLGWWKERVLAEHANPEVVINAFKAIKRALSTPPTEPTDRGCV